MIVKNFAFRFSCAVSAFHRSGIHSLDMGKSLFVLISSKQKPAWHNWSARETLNLKVMGSGPIVGLV